MTTQTEALKLALEALENINNAMPFPVGSQAITAIKEALAQPEQEPDVYIPADALRQLKGTSLLILRSVPLYGYRGDGLTPLYTTPPQRTWVGLTDEEKQACIRHVDELGKYAPQSVADDERLLIEAVEAKLMEKNA